MEEVHINQPDEGTTPPEGHVEKMMEVAEKGTSTTGQPTSPSEPNTEGTGELLLGKFKSAEELAKAYQELEKKLGGGEGNGKTETNTEETKGAEGEPKVEGSSEDEAKKAVSEAGLDFDALTEEVITNGELSEESYKALEKAGIPKEIVDTYIAGQQALIQKQVEQLTAKVGGAEAYDAMISWAEENLSDAEKEAFNKAVSDPDVAELAIAGLYQKYSQSTSNAPTRQLDGSSNTSSVGFQSIAEMKRAMADPRYETDEAYRAEVSRRLAQSNII